MPEQEHTVHGVIPNKAEISLESYVNLWRLNRIRTTLPNDSVCIGGEKIRTYVFKADLGDIV